MPLLLIIIAALGGIAFYSSTASPGNSFYPVRLLIEEGRTSITFDDGERAKYRVQLATTRASEAGELIGANREVDLDRIALSLEGNAKGAVDIIKQFKKRGVSNSELNKSIDQGILDAKQAMGDLRNRYQVTTFQDEVLSQVDLILKVEQDRLNLDSQSRDLQTTSLRQIYDRSTQLVSDLTRKADEFRLSGKTQLATFTTQQVELATRQNKDIYQEVKGIESGLWGKN